MRGGDYVARKRERPSNQLPHANCSRLRRAAAAHGQELLPHLVAVVNRSAGRLEGILRRHVVLGQGLGDLELASNSGKVVVEIVRHACGELPQQRTL